MLINFNVNKHVCNLSVVFNNDVLNLNDMGLDR